MSDTIDGQGPIERQVRPMVAERVAYGAAGAIPMVDVATTGDVFENAIRSIGVVAACEWFGHVPDSEFTRETIRVLQQRAALDARSGDIQNPTDCPDYTASCAPPGPTPITQR